MDWICGGGGIIPGLIKILQILEINVEKLIPITQPTKFKNVVIPDESFFYANDRRFFTVEYQETINRIKNFALKNLTEISQKKIYFFHGRKQIGEERIVEYFKSKGYATVRPETLPLEEQLNILANCTNFASTEGSCSHNSIFLKDNSEVILIPRSFMGKFQAALNEVNNVNVTYVDSAISLFHFQKDNYGPFFYIISKQLKKFFGDDSADEYSEEDLITFLQYVRYSMSHGYKENIKLKEYYSTILPEFYSQLVQRKDLMEKFGVFIK